MKRAQLILLAGVGLFALSFQNCAPVEFAAEQAAEAPKGAGAQGDVVIPPGGTGGDGTAGPGAGGDGTAGGGMPGDNTGSDPGGSDPGGTDPGGSPGGGGDVGGTIPQPGNSLPQVRFIGPPCQIGTWCLAEYKLKEAVPHSVTFNWRTNDTLYLTYTPPAGRPPAGQPNVHYVPTSGSITFAPGETEKQILIKNINPYNYAIDIATLMSECRYNNQPVNCSSIFY